MSRLIVFAAPTVEGAYAMCAMLDAMPATDLAGVRDVAVAVRREDHTVRLQQALDLTGAGTLGGEVWGALMGLLFLSPWLGAAAAGMARRLSCLFAGAGIDDNFIRKLDTDIRPGRSALFVLVDDWEAGRPLPLPPRYDGAILHTTLPAAEEARLRAWPAQ